MFWKRRPKASAPAGGDAEIEALRARLTRRQEEVAALEQELFDLNHFVAEVEAYLLPLQRRLEDLRAQLAQARQHAARRGQWGARSAFADIPEAPVFPDPSGSASHSPDTAPPVPEPPGEAELKALYRALAKRFHPDLAADPAEKAWRQQMMTQVNAAYAARDLTALQALAAQPDHPPDARPKTRAALLAELQAEIERLDGVIAGLEAQLDELAKSPAVQLKLEVSLARHQGHNLLGQIAAELEAEIARAEAELAGLRR
jgi:predicted  nucleic acid-binding Zn-ribbon protein